MTFAIASSFWKDIPGWEGFYQVSDAGELRSCPRRIEYVFNNKLVSRFQQSVTLKTMISPNGYHKASLTKPGTRTQKFIHDLVLLTFVGEKPEGAQVCHNDGDRNNNALSNLRYGSAKDNAQDRQKHGTGYFKKGVEHPRSPITQEQLEWIRAQKGRMTQVEIAKRLRIRVTTVWNVMRGTAYVE